ncbi:MAG TPA: hypothetical protein VKP69_14355 [Isosphaeraceae bacterium]|nr:hypothetical protein [Isosphaeraceae bacterium]
MRVPRPPAPPDPDQRHYRNLAPAVRDRLRPPFPPGTFDHIVALGVLDPTSDPRVHHIERRARRGGPS